MEISENKLKIALKIVKDTPGIGVEDLLALMTDEPVATSAPPATVHSGYGWPLDDEEKLINLYEEGYAVAEIAKMLGKTISPVYTKLSELRANNRVGNRNKEAVTLTQEEQEQLMALYRNGVTYEGMAAQLAISKNVMQRYLTQWLTDGTLQRRQKQHKRKPQPETPPRVESFAHKQIKSFLLQHNDNMDSILPVEYTELAKRLMMDRQACVKMVYEVWKEGEA